MFNLENAIRTWKKTLFSSRNMEDADVAELESHVRDETARLIQEGLDEETAFRKAIDDPESTAALDAEYKKVRILNLNRPAWHPARILPSFIWSHMKIAIRRMRKQKAYAVINTVGLALGITCSFLILYWAQDELGYNRFHSHSDQIFRINKKYQIGGNTAFNPSTPSPLAKAARDTLPDLQDATRYQRTSALVSVGDTVFNERYICATDPSFFRVFTFPALKGDPAAAMDKQGSIVLTEATASKYFGSEEPIGKILVFDKNKSFVVQAILEDIPPNSDIRFDLFVPAADVIDAQSLDNWGNHYAISYVLLQDGAVSDEVEAKLSGLIQERLPEELISASLQPLGKIHLYAEDGSEVGMKFVRIFFVIAFFILVIACINYINLSTARSEKRSKEVGLRKVVGARRIQIAAQFFIESLLFTLIALALSLVLIQLLEGVFRDLTGKTLSLADFEPVLIVGLLAITCLTGLISGIYPALILSSFKPAQTLKDGLAKPRGKASFRKTLVVAQVALTIMMLIGMNVIEKQLSFIRTKDLGFDRNNVLFVRMTGGIRENYEAFRYELLKSTHVAAASRTLQVPGEMFAIVRGLRWEGMEAGESVAFGFIPVDYDTLDLLDIQIVEGRNFSRDFPSDISNVILNEMAVDVMGLDDPIGKTFVLNENTRGTIVGVVENFHAMPLNYGIEPQLFLIDPNFYSILLVKLGTEDRGTALGDIEAAWKTFAPGFPFEYQFLDERFSLNYGPEILAGKLFRYFVLIAVLISCLGLLGLSAFVAEQKTKEIGIRKTLGASIPRIVLLLTKQFFLWVILANIIAWPVAYMAMRNWLNQYPFRTHLGWPLFLLSAAAALVITMVTVGVQAVRAARANPVESLRNEE